MVRFGDKLKNIGLNNDNLFFIGGPCVIEGYDVTFKIAEALKYPAPKR